MCGGGGGVSKPKTTRKRPPDVIMNMCITFRRRSVGIGLEFEEARLERVVNYG